MLMYGDPPAERLNRSRRTQIAPNGLGYSRGVRRDPPGLGSTSSRFSSQTTPGRYNTRQHGRSAALDTQRARRHVAERIFRDRAGE